MPSFVIAALALAGAQPAAAPAAGSAPTCTAASADAPARKKRGLGFGKLLGAARRAGVTDMLTGRLGGTPLGRGGGGQIAGAIAGTALEAAASAEAQGSQSVRTDAQAVPGCGGTP